MVAKKTTLNAAQKEAVEYLDGPLLVLAGPGTGKTQLLSEKVVYILEHTDTNPENILCLTFTESGASNMRERLRSLIHGDALKVNIYTYHAFGGEILAAYRRYSPEHDRKLDAAIDEVTRFKIIKSLQEKLPAHDILRGDSVSDIVSIISDAKSAQLTPDNLKTIAEQNIADAEVLSSSISPLLKNIVPRKFQESYEGAYQPIHEALKDYTAATPILGSIERSIAALARDLDTAISEALATKKIKPLTAWKDAYFEKDGGGNYRLKDRVANKKLLSLARIMKAYEKHLRQEGLYDFDDMIEEALQTLTTDPGFKLSLQERFQFIMLDEFQDTNPSQFAIVKALTDYEKPQIMAVGDDDQAIYEFQGALSSNLTDFQSYYNAKVISLTENYRSTQEILDFSRAVINKAPDRFADKELTAHRKSPSKTSQIFRIEFAGSDAEYAFIANKIAELIKAGVPGSQIAVISYKTKYFEPLLPYLKSHPEIKIAYEKRDDLLADPKIHQIITILRFVSDLVNGRFPSVQLFEILTYPFFDLPPLEVLKLANAARSTHTSLFESLDSADPKIYPSADKFHAAAEFLGEIAANFLTSPIEALINQMLEKILERSSSPDYDTINFYENLASLEGKLHRYAGERTLYAADLLAMIDDYESAGLMLTATSPYRDAEDAVQILTAHKAKGLEFDYVFIISADHTAWGKGKGNNTLLSLPKNVMQIHHTGLTDGERLRVLYVALTRAKHTLFITNSLRDFNGKSPDRLEYFDEYLDNSVDPPEVVSPLIPSRKIELRYDQPTPSLHADNLENWLTTYRPNTPELKLLYLERMKNWRLSASALTTFIDIIYAGPETFFRNYILRTEREPLTTSLALGNLIHKTFEAFTKETLTPDDAIKFFLSEVDHAELPPQMAKDLREEGPEALKISLDTFSSVLSSGEAEVDFSSDHLVVSGVPITGKIDHLTIDEAAKTIELYDFKTSKHPSGKWNSHPSLYKYALQLGFYKLLLNNSPRYKDYQVTRAHILFVTPDKDGQVYDEVYDYTDESEAELLGLLTALYHQATHLDFMDDPELMLSPDKSRTLKDIKAFCDTLLSRTSL